MALNTINLSAKPAYDAENKKRLKREAAEQGMLAGAGDAIEKCISEFFKAILPEWLYKFIFDEDPDAPNERPEDMRPSTAGEKASAARAVYDTGAVKKWGTAKSEYTGGAVTFTSPVSGQAHSTSGYGMRVHPISGKHKMHKGVDLAGGGNILAAADGIVLFSGWKGGFGNTVIIGHADGTKTLYAHMTGGGMAKIGDQVDRGETIGEMGRTGNVTGVHLHFQQYDKNGNVVAPVIDGVAAARDHDHDSDEKPVASAPKLRSLAQATSLKPLKPAATGIGKLDYADVKETTLAVATGISTRIGSMFKG